MVLAITVANAAVAHWVRMIRQATSEIRMCAFTFDLAKGMRPLVIASSDQGVPEGFTVISAASSSEFSGDLPEAEHGLFSYYLMRGLGGEADADGDREISVEELHGYVAENVGRQAARLGREQSPELFGEHDRVLVRY